MAQKYDQIAGRSLERIGALSDGLFAIAMTLIVFEIRLPAQDSIHSEGQLLSGLAHLFPYLITYLMSFLTLGIFWVGQQVLLSHMARSDRHFTWLSLLFLAFVALVPFSTRLLSQFISYRMALLAYWVNLLLLGLVIYWAWAYACRAKLVREGEPRRTYDLLQRRIVESQTLYALGAALCYFDNAYSIAFIVLVQLNYAIAPKIPYLSRLTA